MPPLVQVVILKCAEIFNVVITAITPAPFIELDVVGVTNPFILQSQSTMVLPGVCNIGSDCAPCLKVLINDHECLAASSYSHRHGLRKFGGS